MTYTCPACGKELPRELMSFLDHTERHIVEIIKRDHPDWAEDDGICKKCYDYYKKSLRGE